MKADEHANPPGESRERRDESRPRRFESGPRRGESAPLHDRRRNPRVVPWPHHHECRRRGDVSQIPPRWRRNSRRQSQTARRERRDPRDEAQIRRDCRDEKPTHYPGPRDHRDESQTHRCEGDGRHVDSQVDRDATPHPGDQDPTRCGASQVCHDHRWVRCGACQARTTGCWFHHGENHGGHARLEIPHGARHYLHVRGQGQVGESEMDPTGRWIRRLVG